MDRIYRIGIHVYHRGHGGHGGKTDSQRMYAAKTHKFADYSVLSFSVISVHSVVKTVPLSCNFVLFVVETAVLRSPLPAILLKLEA